MSDVIDQQTLELTGNLAEISVQMDFLHGLVKSFIDRLKGVENALIEAHHVFFARNRDIGRRTSLQ
ncbi:MAG: hypothetical protein CVV42_08620 [Candidatus Riflebacteria bacterium HGW-Riflebacteria-2]|nr:MAG: hypothetical protein CVV42_08620 [Candidatus Riflebacteria bacterium HGW-Riflebacteria-2]